MTLTGGKFNEKVSLLRSEALYQEISFAWKFRTLRALQEEVLFKVIDERYNSMKPSVFTSNFSLKEFRNAFHPRVCSRLFAKENQIIEILNGDDLRQ